jgi:hypothetical protein
MDLDPQDYEAIQSSRGEILRYLFFPPRDLYEPILSAPVEKNDRTFTGTSLCTHRYPGLYALECVCETRSPGVIGVLAPFRLKVVFTAVSGTEDLVLVRDHRCTDNPWWRYPEQSGFTLAYYSVPRSLPLKQPHKVHIELLDVEGQVASYSPKKFQANRRSSK